MEETPSRMFFGHARNRRIRSFFAERNKPVGAGVVARSAERFEVMTFGWFESKSWLILGYTINRPIKERLAAVDWLAQAAKTSTRY